MTDPKHQSRSLIRSSVNNHRWYGLLSTFSWEINSNFTLSGGLDLRTYKAQHYAEVYDLLGGDYMLDNSDKNKIIHAENGLRVTRFITMTMHWYAGEVFFTQLEFKKGNWTAFLKCDGCFICLQTN